MKDLENLKQLAVNIRVLYVEDNDLARKKTYELLTKIFPVVETATNGQDGLALYMKAKYDLVISDIVMSKLNGLEMITSIKKVHKSQRVIFLSSYSDISFLTQAIELGIDGFVFKPIDTDKFYLILEKTLKHIKNIKENIEYKKKFKKLKNIDINLEKSLYKLNRQFLHAKTLGFIHPKSGKELEFSSILPQDLENILKMLRNISK